MTDLRQRSFRITERPQIPWLSVVFGYLPMVPFVGGAIGAWLLPVWLRPEVISLTIIWAAAILAFLGGVRRGLSFRTEGGPALAQIITMFCVYVLAFLALASASFGLFTSAVAMLFVGFLALETLDPVAARNGQAPLFFARLRPAQLGVAVASLGIVFLRLVVR